MEKSNNASAWTEAGYLLFARNGIEGIQVERLARIVGRNKSGFYHYFGDQEGYISQLLSLHKKKASQFLADIRHVRNIDPDYLHAVVNHKVPVLFQLQLIRTKNPEFAIVVEEIDSQESEILQDVWMDYIGFSDNAELALRYLNVVRDMFYARIGYAMDYVFMHGLMTEAKSLIKQFMAAKTSVRNVHNRVEEVAFK
jgi:AcrR family transcriptional regulator